MRDIANAAAMCNNAHGKGHKPCNAEWQKNTTMKLYHATNIENVDSILQYGLWTSESSKADDEERQRGVVTEGEVVYGFNNIQDAITFGYDNNDHIAICVFDVSDREVSVDLEYDDNVAYTVNHNIDPDNIRIITESELDD